MIEPDIGIYALRHRVTGKLYVGSSRQLSQRRITWRRELNRGVGLPRQISLVGGRADDWEFVVLWRGRVTPDELVTREQQTIDALRGRAPDRLLNSATAARFDAKRLTANGVALSERAWATETGIHRTTIRFRLGRGWTPEQALGFEPPPIRDRSAEHRHDALATSKTRVMYGDKQISVREAADRLACSRDSLRDRLRRRRERLGEISVQLSDLQEASERYRKKS